MPASAVETRLRALPASVVVTTISRSDAELATKSDLKAEITAVRSVIDKLEASTKTEIAGLKADLWKTSSLPCGGDLHTPLPKSSVLTDLDQTTTTNTTGKKSFAL